MPRTTTSAQPGRPNGSLPSVPYVTDSSRALIFTFTDLIFFLAITGVTLISFKLDSLIPGLTAIALAYIVLEVAFFIYGKFKYVILNSPIIQYPNESRADVSMERFLDLNNIFDLDEFLSGWFFGASVSRGNIPRENVIEFVAYGFFCKKYDDLSAAKQQQVFSFVDSVEKKFDVSFPPGYDASLKFMAHIWEPMRVHHKPLFAYIFAEFAATIAHAFLFLMGFRRKKQGKFVIWIRIPSLSSYSNGRGNNITSHTTTSTTTVTHRSDIKTRQQGSTEVPITSQIKLRSPPPPPPRPSSPAGHVAHAAHVAAEHALDAALLATSAAVATVSQQYPHQGQQYHLPSRPSSPSGYHTATSMNNNNNGMSSNGNKNGDDNDNDEYTTPCVFLHGVGFGILPYLHFIRDLIKACPSSPIIILEVPHVALRLCKEALPVDEVARAAVTSVQNINLKRGNRKQQHQVEACFIAHSYGTFVASRIVQLYPKAVHSTVLIDPVCLMTCYPQLLFNFIYRSFSFQQLFASPLNSIIDGVRLICSRDLTIAQAFSRKFHWSELMLWPEDLPKRKESSLIVLSGKDDLVPSELVIAQFEGVERSGHARVIHHADLGHGGFLMNARWLGVVVEGIRRLVARRGEEEEDFGNAT